MVTTTDEYIGLIEILEDVLGHYKYHNSYKRQISFDCPVCSYEIKGLEDGDGKGNLEVNYGMGVYKCWACGETHDTHGSIYKLLKQHGDRDSIKRYMLLALDFEHTLPDKPKYKRPKLPKEYIAFNEAGEGLKLTHYYKQALNYIKRRNITDEMIEKYKIGFCYEGKYSNRIVIPSYDENGKLNYYITRSYLPKVKKKYDNPEIPKEEIIWNEHLIDWTKPVYLVEGVFDHIFLPNSIPLLGKKISPKLFKLLYEKAVEIIIVLDGDAWGDTERIYSSLNGGRLLGKIRAIKLPIDQDIADLQGRINNYKKIQLHR